MNRSELESIARAMVAKGKGILAADESSGTIKKRFDSIKLESTEEARRTYREMLFTAAGTADYISGVIMYDETIRQKTKDGTPFSQYLQKLGVVPGIASASPSTTSSARVSPSGARSSTSARAIRRSSRSIRMRTHSRVTQRCARKRTSCRSSSPKC